MTERPTVLSPAALHDWLTQPGHPRLLDVRTPAEYAGLHIPGSYNVPLDLLGEHREDLLPHLDEHTVLICRSGQRAGQANQLLTGSGLSTLHILDGGVQAWERAGLPVRKAAAKWALERQVRFAAGSLVLGGLIAGLMDRRFRLLSAGVSAGLVFSALTDSCAMGALLARLPYNRDDARSLAEVLGDLHTEATRLATHPPTPVG